MQSCVRYGLRVMTLYDIVLLTSKEERSLESWESAGALQQESGMSPTCTSEVLCCRQASQCTHGTDIPHTHFNSINCNKQLCSIAVFF